MKTRTLIALPLVTIATLVGCDATPLYIGFMRVDGGGAASTSTTSTTGGGGGGALLCSPGATQPCYSGPAGTASQGICEAGTQVCAADGMSWAACSGEVLPGVEDCATAEDEDCDGLAPPCKGSLLWAKNWEGVQATGATVGPDGAALITGFFGGLVDFGGGPVTAAGPSAGFVVKLDADGHHLWSVPIQGPNVGPTAIAVDAFGNIAIVGFFLGVFDAGGGARAGVADEDVFIVKLDADGHHLWSKSFGGPLTDAAVAVAFDAAGDVLATGYFSTTIDFGGSALMSAGGHDVFLTKLHGADGSSVWSRSFGDAQDQNGSSITADLENNVLVTGDFAGFMDFGGGTLESAGGQDLFVAKLDPSGGYVWAKRFGDIADQWGAAVATDGEGNVAVTGSMMGVVDFGGGVLTSAGGRDTFVVKLGPSGEYVWAKRFGDAADQRGLAMAMDAAGSVVVTGALMGQADFGGPDGPIASVGGADVFVAKLAPIGEYVWAKRFGDTAAQAGAATALTGNGNAVISGVFQGTMDLGGGVQLTSAGTPGAFIAAFGP